MNNTNTIKLLGFDINPKCSMDDIEKQFNNYGLKDKNIGGNAYCSFLEFGRDGFKDIHIRGKKDGSSVWEIEERYFFKWSGFERKSLWRKHWWTRLDK